MKDKDASDDDHPSKITATVTLGKKEPCNPTRRPGKERYRGLGVTVIPPPPAQPSAPKIKQPKFNRARQIAIMNPRKVRKQVALRSRGTLKGTLKVEDERRILTGTVSGFFLET